MSAIQTIGIIGAGTMGNGIAQACATSGLQVVMVDINEAAVQKGIATVSGSLDRLIKKEKLTAAEKDAALARIKKAAAGFPHYAVPRSVCLTQEPWTIENTMMTPTLKLKRNNLMHKFAADIEAMYRR